MTLNEHICSVLTKTGPVWLRDKEKSDRPDGFIKIEFTARGVVIDDNFGGSLENTMKDFGSCEVAGEIITLLYQPKTTIEIISAEGVK